MANCCRPRAKAAKTIIAVSGDTHGKCFVFGKVPL